MTVRKVAPPVATPRRRSSRTGNVLIIDVDRDLVAERLVERGCGPDCERPRSVLSPADHAPAIPPVLGAGAADDSRPVARRDDHTARRSSGGFNGHGTPLEVKTQRG